MEGSVNSHSIRPSQQHRFRPAVVCGCIREVLREHLSGESYDLERSPELIQTLSSSISHRVRELGLERYKLVVQVVMGEQKGEGVQMASRCFWDADTDGFAKDIYINDTLFCVAAVFGVYYY
ncbi:dynein light chain Tctex-type protein 2B [Hoplias malabaricus]|uniref:dynein light chain Tctex-type protein 2B n=1 Tax=Hoplias malabaricus TaxID=27720 RepID=UPI0034634AC9